MSKNKIDKIILFIRFLKENELYSMLINNDRKITMRNLNIKDKLLYLPTLFCSLTNNTNININDKLTAQWEEFYLYHIHKKTKIQVLKETMNQEQFNLLTSDVKTQHKYESIENVLKYNTLQACVDKAITWGKTNGGTLYYMALYQQVNNYLIEKYKDLYEK